ncbi:UPF0158 family protein [Spirosoma endophyticum]|uniref:Uncharacterized protein family (UPF0158) n=1 Tax=Spirosoma endophyticum TaxID=662367 RepID=A0A1I2HYM5_9BACT|nr:UPF0158 family protein [Spirosoma endophyticum]SFF34450.1 Uncharacterised protein family (UPF0158) [Spirosoma endophyticum]
MIHLDDSLLNDILEQQQLGMSCYVHRQTGQLITVPDPDQFSELETQDWQADMHQVEMFPEQYWPVPNLSSRDQFRFMEAFVHQLPEGLFQRKLLVILSRPKPFRHFKDAIDRSGSYRLAWFAFRNEQTLLWLKRQLSLVE